MVHALSQLREGTSNGTEAQTAHRWAFGGIAELLDNAVDELDTKWSNLFFHRQEFYSMRWEASFVNSSGRMDPEAIRCCMSFGYTDKKTKLTIGQYGNGFKTSSMRLGADVMVFSRHRSLTQSVGILSYTFLSRMVYDDILVPMWAVKDRKGYTQQQLDEVRIEVADYLQTLL